MTLSTSIRSKFTAGALAFIVVLCAIDWTFGASGGLLRSLADNFYDKSYTAMSETRRVVANLAARGTADATPPDANVGHEVDGLLTYLDTAVNLASNAKAREAATKARTAAVELRGRLLELSRTPQEKPNSDEIDGALAQMAEQFASDATAYRSHAGEVMANYYGRCLMLTGAAVALAALAFFGISRSILPPLRRVATIATAIAEGNFNTPIAADGRDEISRVLRALSNMQKKISDDKSKLTSTNAQLHFTLLELETRERELQKYKYSLEKLVTERTAELAENNEQLKNEISRRHRTEQDLVTAKELADTANRTKSQFLANMSHEIRTPMNGVIGMVDLLRQTGLAPRQEHFATVIRQSARALLTIINDLLDFSKIEAGELTLDISSVDLRACADDVANLLAEAAQKKGVELTYLIGDAVPQLVRGDLARIRQILVNLVGNAIKFTERGDVTIHIEALPIGMSSGLARIRFDIRDSGIGIPKEAINSIFDAFRQVDSGTNRRFEGTGLGLSIVQQLVKLMGGRIEVESEVGRGSLFRVELTLAVLKSAEQTTVGFSATFPGKRALVVDDSEASRKVIEHYLSKLRIAGTGAVSADAALHALALAESSGQPYDLAVIDAVMPGMSGIDLVKRMRANPAGTRLPVVLLTSLGPTALAAAQADLGNLATLTKPLREADFREQIGNILAPAPRALTSFAPVSPALATGGGGGEWAALNLRTLLAEDSPVNQEIAREHLVSFGCQVDAVANGEEALSAFDARDYDVIVMDCQMPGMDGFEAASHIRRRQVPHGPLPRIPIIALTAFASKADRERCLAAGIDDCLTKPFEPADLYRMLERWTAGRAVDAPVQPRQPGRPKPAEPAAELDPKAIQSLRHAPGANGPALFEKVGRLFLETMPKDLADLAAAVEANAADTVATIAHKLKSVSGNIGARELAGLFRNLEDAAAAGTLRDARMSLRQIDVQFERTARTLREMTDMPRAGAGPAPQRRSANG